jgi:hypothetical protein
MINVVGEVGIEIAQRIVRKSGQMHDRIKTLQIRL